MITRRKGLAKKIARSTARTPKAIASKCATERVRRAKTKKSERVKDLKAKIAELGRFASFPILNPNPIVELDLSGNIIFMNNAAKNVLREANLGERGVMFLPADIETILADARNKVSRDYYREVTIKGRVFEERIYHSPEYHSLRIYANDITEKKSAEEQLRRSHSELKQRQKEFTALLQGSSAALRYDNFMDAAKGIFNACKDVIGATSGYIAIVSEDGKRNEVVYLDSGSLSCTVDPDAPMPIRGLRGEVYNRSHPIYHNDFSRSEWAQFLPDGHVRIENVLMSPMIIGNKVVGLFGLGNKSGGFTDHDVQIAFAFSEFAAISLMRKHAEGALREAKDFLQRANEELERQVQERTEDLFDAYETVLTERQRFFSVLEKIPGYVCLLTRHYTFSYVNEEFKKRFGDPKGQPCYSFFFNRQTPCDTCITFKVCDDLKPQQREWIGPDKRIYAVSDYPFTDVDGTFVVLELGIDITDRKKAEEEVIESREKLRGLYANLQAAVEAERKKIAREIHDEFATILTALNIDLAWLENKLPDDQPALKERIRNDVELIGNAMRIAQRISSELRPGVLDYLGFSSAVEALVKEFGQRTGIDCDVSIDEKSSRLDNDVSLPLFRILQEALTNIARHAGASKVTVVVTHDGNNLTLKVHDNGRGVREKDRAKSHSYGIFGMKERVEYLGGMLDIRGFPAEGTTLTVTVPVAYLGNEG